MTKGSDMGTRRSPSAAAARRAFEVLAERNDEYLFGKCVDLAVALHDRTGWPLYGLVAYDKPIRSDLLIHAYVKPERNLIVDVRGPRDYESMRMDFIFDPATEEATEQLVSKEILARIGLGRARCPTPRRRTLALAERIIALSLVLRPDLARREYQRWAR